MSKTAWIIFTIISLGALVGLVYLSSQNKTEIDVDDVNASQVLSATEQSGNIADHVLGDRDSKVVLIEYADFQCPGCAGAFSRVEAVGEEYKDDIAVVLRNFPLVTIHQHALAAAATAEAAGAQGKYWQMANLLFTNQNSWANQSARERTQTFLDYAHQLGLNQDKFKEDQSSPGVSKKIAFDQALAGKVGVSSTPTFFLNGKKLSQDVWGDDAALKKAIEDAIKEAGDTPPSETK